MPWYRRAGTAESVFFEDEAAGQAYIEPDAYRDTAGVFHLLAPTPVGLVDPAVKDVLSGSAQAGGSGGKLEQSVPGVVKNFLFEGEPTGGEIPILGGDGLSALKQFAVTIWGSEELGVIRRSSEVLENEPSGIRPGTMERIVIPSWARNQRGSPI